MAYIYEGIYLCDPCAAFGELDGAEAYDGSPERCSTCDRDVPKRNVEITYNGAVESYHEWTDKRIQKAIADLKLASQYLEFPFMVTTWPLGENGGEFAGSTDEYGISHGVVTERTI